MMSGSEPARFDLSRNLDDDEERADYIRPAIEDGDPWLLAAALGDRASAGDDSSRAGDRAATGIAV
jgi:DNA-binding phage protein